MESIEEFFQEMQVFSVDVGDNVICDICGENYTDLPDSGGIVFGYRACCPICAPEMEERAKFYHEEEHLGASCPEGMSFADWVRDMLRD